ncbi:PTS sugar transporter subunit IIA [Enterococcus devriesei]|uniref:PTS sugar transporter subunit IIA n=1 Tax=Enterococcus devriesei TaxID=319970 RepID=UPI001C0FCCB1|nr:PTS sugar transporter subunit IIA [Enterococcus devriesei]MBU5366725.1 PTS sugar transporter subunit IIA [Enterococcus devriesei]
MRKVIIASHGLMAKGVKDSVEMISGKQENLSAFSMEAGESPQDVIKKIENILEYATSGEEIILVSDFPGGSINTAMMSLLGEPKISQLSGLNIPMVLELVLANNAEPIAGVLDKAVESGKKAVSMMELQNEKQNEEEDFYD